MDKLMAFLKTYFDWLYITRPDVSDIIEILILSYVIYKILLWFKSSRAWTLLKGIVLIFLSCLHLYCSSIRFCIF